MLHLGHRMRGRGAMSSGAASETAGTEEEEDAMAGPAREREIEAMDERGEQVGYSGLGGAAQ